MLLDICMCHQNVVWKVVCCLESLSQIASEAIWDKLTIASEAIWEDLNSKFSWGACPQTHLVGTHAYACVSVLSHATIILLPSCSPSPTQNPVWNQPPCSRQFSYSHSSGAARAHNYACLIVWGEMEEDEQPSEIKPRAPTLSCQSSDHWATTTELQPPALIILSVHTAPLAGRAW